MLRFIFTISLLLCESAKAFVPSATKSFVSPAAISTTKVLLLQSRQHQQQKVRDVTFLGLSSSDGDESDPQKQRRRRRRKDAVAPSEKAEKEDSVAPSSPPPPPPSPPPELKAREDTPVELEIQDIRNVMSGGGSTTEKKDTESSSVKQSSLAAEDTEDDDEDDDDEYEYYYEDEEGNEVVVPNEEVDSLSQLLADARQMREQDAASSSSAASKLDNSDDEEDKGGITVPDSVRNVISTIVTFDFFFVCALLLWFLAGIASRAVFNDDTIQIAFNNNFELIVQPALGVLMIAAAAGAVLKEEETE
mmetsp:Transcript_18631/g.26289  ORF Transcript_18631/g.26289 Transcript_18631/m.26289 type:complete len:305 (-) Transcript_18631:166-1080(-)